MSSLAMHDMGDALLHAKVRPGLRFGKRKGNSMSLLRERREHSSRQLEPELAIRTIISLCSTWPQSTRSSLQSRPHSSLRYVSQDIGLDLPSFTPSCILPLVHLGNRASAPTRAMARVSDLRSSRLAGGALRDPRRRRFVLLHARLDWQRSKG